ncbi:MAG: RtcB family protein [Sulfurimonas sp.]|nr:RtcB family protein [Sulfurimonas sp.]
MDKKIKIYAEILEDEALKQFNDAMELECNVQGALMPDAHTGYTLPIGAVIKSKGKIFPSYVGYDIGCGMCGVKLDIYKKDLDLERLKQFILETIPLGSSRHHKAQDCEIDSLDRVSSFTKNKFEQMGRFQIGTLGGGNHFIELGTAKDEKVWIIIHSGSRGFGHKIAEYYMKLAVTKSIDRSIFSKEFEDKNQDFKKYNPNGFEKSKIKYIDRSIEKYLKNSLEGHYALDINSQDGQDYISDMNCALEFALANRKAMIEKIVSHLENPKELMFINTNHNHAEMLEDDFVIHRKGATHANLGYYGVIPGNMKDGSFVVIGKGCKESLNSSSHGAGRVLSRKQAKLKLDLDEFHESMREIVTNHSDDTLDESEKAYKNIFEVMELQKDLLEVVDHVKPFLNIKG